MEIDTSKLYPVKMVFVKPYFRRNFQRPSLIFKVEIPEALTTTTRTLNLPKTLNLELANPRCKFKQVLGPILQKHYPDSLLGNLSKLADALDEDLSGRTFMAYLSNSKSGDYINVDIFAEKAEDAA